MEETSGRASLEKLGCRTPPQLHAGGVGRQQQHMSVFCRGGRGDWTDVGELGGEWAGDSEGVEDWTGEEVGCGSCFRGDDLVVIRRSVVVACADTSDEGRVV